MQGRSSIARADQSRRKTSLPGGARQTSVRRMAGQAVRTRLRRVQLGLEVGFTAFARCAASARRRKIPQQHANFGQQKTGLKGRFVQWWRGWESNPRPHHCERCALPTELPPHTTPPGCLPGGARILAAGGGGFNPRRDRRLAPDVRGARRAFRLASGRCAGALPGPCAARAAPVRVRVRRRGPRCPS